jgi:hypothetical protein
MSLSLQLREGGVDEAIQALPRLRNHTLGHVAVFSVAKKVKNDGKQAVRWRPELLNVLYAHHSSVS